MRVFAFESGRVGMRAQLAESCVACMLDRVLGVKAGRGRVVRDACTACGREGRTVQIVGDRRGARRSWLRERVFPGHKSLCTLRAESSLIKGQHTERFVARGVRRQILVYCSSSSSRPRVFSSVQVTAGARERVRQIESELGAQQTEPSHASPRAAGDDARAMAWRAGGGARDVERGSLATGPKASPSPRWPLRFSLSGCV
ncbi:hypothetical protein PVAP13_9NG606000 [Panicum virgatum]|uniref:Uncharacterized protein n=1 Tax=Panicum virgatum TaxID=38727 RepID=A0A8T0MX63_PANVG|nr:hypothetical protein PVAP13_9NG606000 [Panicum virgatum]